MFHASEVFEFARAIEENGRAFYQAMGTNARQPELRQLFARLSQEEEQHILDFTRLAARATPYDPPESYPGEYAEYMQALVDNSVFPRELDPETLAQQITTDQEAINLAIQFEKDSLLFFNGLKNLVSVTETAMIEELLRQERRHLCELHSVLQKK
ncbi:Rubrerythrin [Neomoorella glycerini]|uniref:Rubrerythrin n=1 Tax=Neomoorella glycerini TaxID=55779 RepID=A0A6I5ZW21_9FIRM|nr:ferritin family protein [Moorella glycerini]QGP93657.1 Rubrerythrin [Moorella glycerini]